MGFLVPSLKKTKDVDFGQSAKLQEQLVRLTSKASAPAWLGPRRMGMR